MSQQNTDMLDGLQAAVIAEAQKKKENTQNINLIRLKCILEKITLLKAFVLYSRQ